MLSEAKLFVVVAVVVLTMTIRHPTQVRSGHALRLELKVDLSMLSVMEVLIRIKRH